MADEVWVFAEHQDGKIRKVTHELLGKGRGMASTLGVNMAALLFGSGVNGMADEVAAYADKVYLWDDTKAETYNNDVYIQVISDLVGKESPQILLAGATVLARDFFPRLAARLHTGIAVDCVDLQLGDGGQLTARRPVFGGKVLVDVVCRDAKPRIALVRPNTFAVTSAGDGTNGEIVKLQPEIDHTQVRLEVQDVVRVVRERLDLTEAEIIVTGGNGIQSAENFKILEELADVLGATVGGTRSVVDSGWRPHDDQVGKSGKTVSPKLYIAVGLSGAIHHVMGMDTSKVIVAINKDPRAPIFQYADYGIIGDLFDVIPILTEELKKALGKG